MLANKLFPLLMKPEVQELILLSGKPPCAVVNGSYRRLSAQVLQDDDVMAVIASAQGAEYASQLADGVEWDFVAPGVGKVAATARYDGANLRMTLRLAGLSVQDLPAVEAKEVPRAAAEPRARRDAAGSGEPFSADRAAAEPRARRDAAGSGEPFSADRAAAVEAPARAQRAQEPHAREARARPRRASSQNLPVQPNQIAEALELDSLAPAARLKPPQQRLRGAPDITPREGPARSEPEAFDPSLRDDLAPASYEAHEPLPRSARERDPGAESREALDPLSREAREPLSREGFGGLLSQEPAAFAAEPSEVQARRIQDLDSLDEPAAPPPRAAARSAKRDYARTSGKSDALDLLFDRARELRASDLHVLADRPATLRIAGELVSQPEVFDPRTLEQLLLPRIPAAVRATLDRDGSCDFALAHPEHGRFRANVGRQRTGLKLTARPIGETVLSLAELGLPSSIESALEHHQGLIVITGPTGQGKTTTLAALTGILNRETSRHVITVEDPIEYVHPTAKAVISQREVGTHTKSFAAALKGSLREDPDVIVVGELRDTETVRMALSASETGHLVISTMNTPSAAKAIERLIDLFPPGDQPQVRMTLAGGLRLIISQRLVPTADRKQLVAACEVLPGSTPLWALIRENRTFQIASLQQRGRSIGIIRMDDSLADLVKSGKTSLEIAREYADSTELLATLIQGRPQPVRADQQSPENQNDPDNSLQKRGVELGKQVLSRAGKLFGGENK